MLTVDNLIEAAGILAATAIALLSGLAIVANIEFKAHRLPADDQEEN